MPFTQLLHSVCNLPTQDLISKVHAEPGSVWKCGDAGCNKSYVLESDYSLLEISTIEVVQGNRVPVGGLSYREQQLASKSQAEIVQAEYEELLRKATKRQEFLEQRTQDAERELVRLRAQIEELQKIKKFWR